MKKDLLFLVVTALSLSACAGSENASRAANDPADDLDFRGSDCILIRTIRDYTPLDREHLLIYGPGRRAYFVTLLQPVFDMRGSIGVRVESRDDQLCPFGGDRLVFGSFGGDEATVRSISRLTEEQREILLVRYGLQGPGEPATDKAPAEVKGAEVEELDQVGPGFRR